MSNFPRLVSQACAGVNTQRPLLTTTRIAARYGVRASTVRAWLRRGLLDGCGGDAHWRVSWEDIFQFEGHPPDLTDAQMWQIMNVPPVSVPAAAARLAVDPETVRCWIHYG